MKKGELMEVFKWLSGIGYSRFDKPTENMVNVWFEIMNDVPDGYALKGVKSYTSVSHPYEKFPLPANIRETALALKAGDESAKKAMMFATRSCFERCLAVFPGAYREDRDECMKWFCIATQKHGIPANVATLVENYVRNCEKSGRINEVGTLTDYLRSLGDGYKGRDGVDRRTLDGQQAMETSKAHPSPGDAV